MKKFFIFAMLLAAGTLAFNSCNNKKDEPKAEEEQEQAKQDQGSDIFKAMTFVRDYTDKSNNYIQDHIVFGQKNEFEWSVKGYSDAAHTKEIVHMFDRGTYEPNSSKSTIYINSTDGFYFDGVDTISHGPNRKHTTYTYSYGDDVLTLSDDQGNSAKYDKQ